MKEENEEYWTGERVVKSIMFFILGFLIANEFTQVIPFSIF